MLVTSGLFIVGKIGTSCNDDDDNNGGYYDGYYDSYYDGYYNGYYDGYGDDVSPNQEQPQTANRKAK